MARAGKTWRGYFEVGEELCFIDGDGVVGSGTFQQEFVGFDGGQPMPVVRLHPGAFVVGMVDDQALHTDGGPPIDFAHEFGAFSGVHATDDNFE